MKQYITVEDLKQLSEKQCDKLLVWMLSKHYSRELTIGQMIEFLDENMRVNEIKMIKENEYTDNKVWNVHSVKYWKTGEKYNESMIHWLERKELCDCLWEVIKRFLEK